MAGNTANNLTEAKKSIVAVCREMLRLGLTVGTWGNVSIYSHEHRKVIITPSGIRYDYLNPADLVTLDLDGGILAGSLRPSVETPLHLAVYRHRKELGAVIHTHSIYATAAAVAGVSIPALVEDMAQIVGGGVEVADYAPAGSRELVAHAVAALGNRNAVLLANHGMVGVGETIDEAWRVCQVVEKTAQIYACAKMLGAPKALPEQDVKDLHEFYNTKYKRSQYEQDKN